MTRSPAANRSRRPSSGRYPLRRNRLRWRANKRERVMPMPGDDLVPFPLVQSTHAVTIAASPERVWPWLVQTGQGRAGFYSDSKFWLSRHRCGQCHPIPSACSSCGR